MPIFPSLPDDADTRTLFDARPEFFRPWIEMSEMLMRGESAFSTMEREMIGAYVSALNDCSYCYGGHRAAAEAFGLDPDFLESVLADINAAPVEERLKPVLRYLRKLTLTPSRMVQADADAVFAAGWDEAALTDAILICCSFSFMNRLVCGHGIKLNPERVAERTRKNLEMGYSRQFVEVGGGENG